jgi:hypothetical protein
VGDARTVVPVDRNSKLLCLSRHDPMGTSPSAISRCSLLPVSGRGFPRPDPPEVAHLICSRSHACLWVTSAVTHLPMCPASARILRNFEAPEGLPCVATWSHQTDSWSLVLGSQPPSRPCTIAGWSSGLVPSAGAHDCLLQQSSSTAPMSLASDSTQTKALGTGLPGHPARSDSTSRLLPHRIHRSETLRELCTMPVRTDLS